MKGQTQDKLEKLVLIGADQESRTWEETVEERVSLCPTMEENQRSNKDLFFNLRFLLLFLLLHCEFNRILH